MEKRLEFLKKKEFLKKVKPLSFFTGSFFSHLVLFLIQDRKFLMDQAPNENNSNPLIYEPK